MIVHPEPNNVKMTARRKHHQKRSRLAPSFSRNSRANESIMTMTAIQNARFSRLDTSGLSIASCSFGIRFSATSTKLTSGSVADETELLPAVGVGVGTACPPL